MKRPPGGWPAERAREPMQMHMHLREVDAAPEFRRFVLTADASQVADVTVRDDSQSGAQLAGRLADAMASFLLDRLRHTVPPRKP
jgi:hypothetical protein